MQNKLTLTATRLASSDELAADRKILEALMNIADYSLFTVKTTEGFDALFDIQRRCILACAKMGKRHAK